MIKPASPLPFYLKDWITEKSEMTFSSIYSKDTCVVSRIKKQDAEYIQVACNLFPELVEAVKKFSEWAKHDGRNGNIQELKDLLKRCGVDV